MSILSNWATKWLLITIINRKRFARKISIASRLVGVGVKVGAADLWPFPKDFSLSLI